jgi:hypothetical protein
MKALIGLVYFAFAAAFFSTANAQVTYTATDVSGTTWQYDYSITNPLAVAIQEFTVFFDVSQFSNLTVQASPNTWNSIVAQPDPGLPADGFFDSLALNNGLAPGATQGGFSVQTTFSGAGKPGSQLFNFVDSITFEILSSGDTTPASHGGGGGGGFSAPEIDPSSAVAAVTLLLGGLAVIRGRKSSK